MPHYQAWPRVMMHSWMNNGNRSRTKGALSEAKSRCRSHCRLSEHCGVYYEIDSWRAAASIRRCIHAAKSGRWSLSDSYIFLKCSFRETTRSRLHSKRTVIDGRIQTPSADNARTRSWKCGQETLVIYSNDVKRALSLSRPTKQVSNLLPDLVNKGDLVGFIIDKIRAYFAWVIFYQSFRGKKTSTVSNKYNM